MDVKTKNGEGIDAMAVIMNKGGSNEKSLMQNFSNAGVNLDKLFIEKKDKEALDLFKTGYINKIKRAKEEKALNGIFSML